MIHHQVKLHLRIDGRNTTQNLSMLNLGKWNNIILGYPWLTKNNLRIDWTTGEVHMIGTPILQHNEPEMIERRYLLQYLGAVERDKSEYAAQIYAQQRNMATLRQVLGKSHPHIRKLTLSTVLAQAAEKVEQKLSLQYAEYTKVFDEPKDRKLPPQWPFNHAINLKETFTPKVAQTYPMNPKEIEACKEFIDKHLKSGKIRKYQ